MCYDSLLTLVSSYVSLCFFIYLSLSLFVCKTFAQTALSMALSLPLLIYLITKGSKGTEKQSKSSVFLLWLLFLITLNVLFSLEYIYIYINIYICSQHFPFLWLILPFLILFFHICISLLPFSMKYSSLLSKEKIRRNWYVR